MKTKLNTKKLNSIFLILILLGFGNFKASADSSNANFDNFSFDITATATPENCYFECSGYINLEISGGTPPFNFEWSNGSNEQNIDSLCPDLYHVIVTDSTGCIDSTQVYVSDSSFEYDLFMSETPESWQGANDGTASAEVLGNPPDLIFIWNTNPPQVSQTATCLSEGMYCVTVTDLTNGCTATNCIIVNSIYCGLDLEVSNVNFTCPNSCDGAIDLTVISGVPPFNYLWSDGNTNEDRSMLCINDYSVTVTDSTGCNYTIATSVEAYDSIFLSFELTPQGCSFSCDGSIDMTVEGGAPPYTFLWSNGETIEDIDSLCLDFYFVTVTDSNGCGIIDGIHALEVPAGLVVENEITGTSCGGACDGSIDISLLTGSGPYDYDWEDDSLDGLSNPVNLCSGDYTLTITDANGCTGVSYNNVQDITDISPTFEVVNANCPQACNGSIDLTVENGTPPFTFLWSNGATTKDIDSLCSGGYYVTITDSLGCEKVGLTLVSNGPEPVIDALDIDPTCFGECDGTIEIAVTNMVEPLDYNWSDDSFDGMQILIGLCEGFYNLTVTDALGCESSISIFINEPPGMTVNITTTDVTCFGECDGSASLDISNGEPPYIIDWPTDMLCAGNYTATITDANGCSTAPSFTINQPDEIEIIIDDVGHEMNGQGDGFINVTVNGGTPSYSYNWMFNGSIVSTDEDPINLIAGTYILLIIDTNGCELSSEEIVVDNFVGVIDHNLREVIDVFPNPTQGFLQINFDLNESQNVEIEVFNFTGKKILELLERHVLNQRLLLDLSPFNEGVYTIKINIYDAFMIERIVKHD